ncbi:IS200/IS605 family accessory protein TnpB-related protein [Methylobacterium sp. JK268]
MGDLHGRIEHTLHAAFKAGRSWSGDLQLTLYKRFDVTSQHVDHVRRGLEGKLKAVREGAAAQAKGLREKAKAKTVQAEAKDKRLRKERLKRQKLDAKRQALHDAVAAARDPETDTKVAKRKAMAAAKAHDALPEAHAKVDKADQLIDRLKHEIHQHRRKADSLLADAKRLDERAADPSLAFGTRDLFAAQHALVENGFASHEDWLKAWRDARSGQFISEGNRAFAGGNQFVRLDPRKDGTFSLEIRLPRAVAHLSDGGYLSGGTCVHSIVLDGLRFEHGRDTVADWLIQHRLHALDPTLPPGPPVSYRFVRDEHGWRVMVTAEVRYAEPRLSYENGALGIDLNEHDAVATLADVHGNPCGTWTFPLPAYGRTDGQRLDMVRQVAARLAELARELRVPLVVEKLDFAAKRAELGCGEHPRRARQLSLFAFSEFDRALASAALRAGVALRRVNPAYTSLIGRVSYAPRYGLSVHAAAALCVARRAMRLSERLPKPEESPEGARPGPACVPVRLDGGDLVTLAYPVRKARRHVWSSWRRLHSAKQAVHVARARARREARSTGASGREATAGPPPAKEGRGGSPPRRASGGVAPPARSSGLRTGPARERVRPPQGRRKPTRLDEAHGSRSTEASR